jgi:hypothetical protein
MFKRDDRLIAVARQCPHCNRPIELTVDAGQVVAVHVLRQVDELLAQVVDAHARALSAAVENAFPEPDDDTTAEEERAPLPGVLGYDAVYHQIDQLRGELKTARRERDEFRRKAGELDGRLAKTLADQTSARKDVGTATHTKHRELASELASLLPQIHAVARQDKTKSREAWSRAAASIFRALLAPAAVTQEDSEIWQRLLKSSDGRAAALASQAEGLAGRISAAPGYQQWLWDIAPPLTFFDPAFHDPWQNCELDGTVKFVVIPAYLVDFTVISKPQVYTNW